MYFCWHYEVDDSDGGIESIRDIVFMNNFYVNWTYILNEKRVGLLWTVILRPPKCYINNRTMFYLPQ